MANAAPVVAAAHAGVVAASGAVEQQQSLAALKIAQDTEKVLAAQANVEAMVEQLRVEKLRMEAQLLQQNSNLEQELSEQ